MSLNAQKLAQDLKSAFESARLSRTEDSLTTLCNSLAQAIYNYLVQATVSTEVTGIASGGVNASAFTPGAVPGPITSPATVTGKGTGTLS